ACILRLPCLERLLRLVADIEALATISATVSGFASSFAYLLKTPDVLKLDGLLSASLKNSLVVISSSLLVGSLVR
ncbi:MAG: hypothetical protein Q7T78_22285, partial [Rhodoferax sp.]|nr:hypothetical protein [Rhodoferax sp.]